MNAYQITLEAKPQADDPDGVRRVRMALKRLLRSFGLRCTRVEPVTKPVDTGVAPSEIPLDLAANPDDSGLIEANSIPVTGTSARLSTKSLANGAVLEEQRI